jgi:Xaa-Pro aminopeptidase
VSLTIPSKDYAKRRRELMAQMAPNSIAVIAAAHEIIRNRDTHFAFRQDSDFYYLSGFAEPDAVLVLIPGREQGEVIFFCRDRDPTRELWDGRRAGPEGMVKQYGADDAFPVDDIDDILPGLMEGRERVYYSLGRNPAFDNLLMGWLNTIRSKARTGAQPPEEFVDLDHLLHDMRLIKSTAELAVMKRAGEISVAAHKRAMRACKPGMMEYQLESEIIHECSQQGARFQAYPAIVGGGENGCILHYIENNAELKSGDLVLIDAGCELQNYASDITRTFPVNGVFSNEQAALYNVVLAAQEAAFAEISPERDWNASHVAAVRVLCQGLLDLGLLRGDLDEILEQNKYTEFYMHRTGHWLGLDVHDVGDYKIGGEWRVLEPGMVLTVEPGLYIAPDNLNVEQKWRGIGIRIEDDVVVTKDGYELLTPGLPRSVEEIERWMAN